MFILLNVEQLELLFLLLQGILLLNFIARLLHLSPSSQALAPLLFQLFLSVLVAPRKLAIILKLTIALLLLSTNIDCWFLEFFGVVLKTVSLVLLGGFIAFCLSPQTGIVVGSCVFERFAFLSSFRFLNGRLSRDVAALLGV